MRRKLAAAALLTMIAGTSAAVATAGSDDAGVSQRGPIRFERHDLYIEYNATDRDAGLQLFVDGEDWKDFRLRDTRGRRLVDVNARGRLRPVGLTELFFEASEPSFDEVPFSRFRRRFPQGRYRFRGVTVDGRRLFGSDRLSHLIPGKPNVTFPAPGAEVDPDGFKMTWEPVTTPAGVRIVSYQVIVEQGSRELSMYLPPSATSATIPGEFLESGTRTKGEVLARESSGNQTITEFEFRTR